MRCLILAVVALLPATAQAQVFPRLFGAKSTAAQSGCPGGVCPIARTAVAVATAPVRAVARVAENRGNYPAVSSASGYGSSGSVVGGGSTGSLVVGSVLSDGSVVTSVGVSVVALEAPASVEAKEMRAVGAVGDRVAFRRALLTAGRQARESGKITTMEFFVLSAASRNPVALQRMMEAVHEAAIEDGMASVGAIDWDKLLNFIEKLIPLIVKLIDLFS